MIVSDKIRDVDLVGGLCGEQEDAVLSDDLAQISVGHRYLDAVQRGEVGERFGVLLPFLRLPFVLPKRVQRSIEVRLQPRVERLDFLARQPADDHHFARATVNVVIVRGQRF